MNLIGIPISEEQCIGDSLVTINGAFLALSGNVISSLAYSEGSYIKKTDAGAFLPIQGGILTGLLQIGGSGTNSAAKLYFGKTAGSEAQLPIIYNGISDGDAVGGNLILTTTGQTSKIIFNTVSTERMRIGSDGKVGIGLTAPETSLNINGTTAIRADNSGAALYCTLAGTAATAVNYDRLELTMDSANGFSTAYVSTNNNGTAVARALAFKAANTECMRLGTNGNVGIGINSPVTAKLHVVGTIYATGNITSMGDVIAYQSSDSRLKNNITTITGALDKVSSIRGCEYEWNTELQDVYEGSGIGVIAQEVEQVLPGAVVTRDNGFKAVNYESLIPLLIEAIKELRAEVETLKALKA